MDVRHHFDFPGEISSEEVVVDVFDEVFFVLRHVFAARKRCDGGVCGFAPFGGAGQHFEFEFVTEYRVVGGDDGEGVKELVIRVRLAREIVDDVDIS